MYFDVYYLIFVIPALIFSLYAQFKVKSAFNKYSRIRNTSGMTGADVARAILDRSGLHGVMVEGLPETLRITTIRGQGL